MNSDALLVLISNLAAQVFQLQQENAELQRLLNPPVEGTNAAE